MKPINEMKLSFLSRSSNEAFARAATASFLAQLDPTVDELADIKTAVSEAVTNCIVHAYNKQSGDIDIFCGTTEDSLTIEITDYGKGIEDIAKALEPFYTTCEDGERSGMGFTVMQAFCDEMNVQSEKGRTVVTLVKKVSKAD